MDHSLHNTTEVLIVGAGPTGLMMACQLAVHQISFRIIDKNNAPSQHSGALILQARSLEILQQLGIASEALKEGVVADGIDILFNGERIARTSIKDIGGNLSQFPFLLMLEQSKTEKLLLKFLRERGFHVERNTQFKQFVQNNDNIATEVIIPGGSAQTIVSKYLIGADGSKSAIRTFLNIPFEGKTYPKPIYIIDCKAESEIHSGVITFAFSEKSVAGFFPLTNQRWRVDGSFPHRVMQSETIMQERVTKDLPHWNNIKFEMTGCEWFSVSRSQQKHTRTMQLGDCFLAGDSAHVNTPVGAQGMNTGLQDAHNLAWKLAFVIKKKAKPGLLDSYSAERLGISKRFARYADVVFKLATNTNVVVMTFRSLTLKLFFKGIFPTVENKEKWRRRFFNAISQINIRYKPLFRSYKDPENLFLRGSPKPGMRLSYVEFIYDNKNANTHQILDAIRFTLLVLAAAITPELESAARKHNLSTFLIKHTSETEPIYKTLGIANTGYYLIRPDMYIALRSATVDTKILKRFLSQL